MIVEPWVKGPINADLKPNEILIFKFDKRQCIDQEILQNLNKYLSIAELERASRYKFAKDRYSFVIARAILRMVSSKYTKRLHVLDPLVFNPYGKPMLKCHPEFNFNISHSGDMILLGFCLSNALGVDVEVFNENVDYALLARTVFSIYEIDQVSILQNDQLSQGFYNIWTKKESYIKAVGKGLSIPLDQFSVRAFDKDYFNLVDVKWNQNESKRWMVFNLAFDYNYAAACCCHAKIERIKCIDISDDLILEMEY